MISMNQARLSSVLLLLTVACASESQESGGDSATVGADTEGMPVEETPAGFHFTEEEIEAILSWLGPLPEHPPPDLSNAYADDPEAAQLGLRLFYDPRYSGNEEVSCATCHAPEEGFGDARANVSLGIELTGRSSMGLYNGAYGAASEQDTNWQLWDGRADSQWSQALGPPESPVVMGGTRTKIALLLWDEYRDDYESVFGEFPLELRDADGAAIVDPSLKPGADGWDDLSEDVVAGINRVYANFGKALAAYERLLISRDSRFDQYWLALQAGDEANPALSDLEKAGLRVFIGAGRCLGCHSGPNFTDGQFHNIGVPQQGSNIPEVDEGRAGGVPKLLGSAFNCASEWSDHPNKDECAIHSIDADGAEVGAFKTPSLRSISQSGPYMHTGTFDTLEAVIQHYDLGGGANGTFQGTRDELMRPLSLDATERAALVAFLRALDGAPLPEELMGPQQ